jgi:HEAT repeat protein
MIDKQQLRRLILALEGGDHAAKRQTLQSLREQDEKDWADAPGEAVLPLVHALQGQLLPDPKQAFNLKEAATILGNMGLHSKSAVPRLVELLRQGVPDPVREASATALGKIGKDAKVAVGPLVELLANSRPALAARAVRALGSIGCADAGVRSALTGAWLSPLQAEAGKAELAIALCRLRIAAPGLLETVTKTLVASQEIALRKSAAEALAWCNKGDPGVVPALLTASLSDKSEEVRQTAQAGLGQMGVTHEAAVLLCAKQLRDSPYAETALRKSGRMAVPALAKALAAREPGTRVKVARTLGSIGEEAAEAAPALAGALNDTDAEVRLAAAKGLWDVTKAPDLAVPALVGLLAVKGATDLEGGADRRTFLQTVVEALGRIGPPAKGAVPALTAMAKDANRHVRESALLALAKIGAGK